jgi:hypothetical protein
VADKKPTAAVPPGSEQAKPAKKPSSAARIAASQANGLKGGRPRKLEMDAKTLALVRSLGGIQCTTKEAAAVLGVDEDTFNKFRADEPEAQRAWVEGTENGKASLRRNQIKLAEKNATMAIFLGMQYLGQKDLRQQWAWGGAGANGREGDKRVVVIKGGLPDDEPAASAGPPSDGPASGDAAKLLPGSKLDEPL